MSRPAKPRIFTLRFKETVAGWFFVGPVVFGLLLFTVIPILGVLIIAFHDWNFVKGWDGFTFVGLEHFGKLFTDSLFLKSVENSFVFLTNVPITMVLALSLAMIINKQVYFKNVFKVMYFMPYISSVVAVAIVWQVLFHPSLGPVNQTLMFIGVSDPPDWIASIQFALPSVVMIYVWIHIGFNMVIFLAGLQTISPELYEAADIDGASPWTKFTKITLPMLSPTTFFLLITGVIESFKVFGLIEVLTSGGPAHATTLMVYAIYEAGIVHLDYGYGSAMSIMLMLVVLVVAVLQWHGQRRWVHY